MELSSIEHLKTLKFKGFVSISHLQKDASIIPKEKGIYMVLDPNQKNIFLKVGSGGFFKGKNPNVSIDELEKNWVDNAFVLYIGKAGASNSSATLYSRLKQYLNFGKGKNVGHWGGRYIWQMANSDELVICWLPLDRTEPRDAEKLFIKLFVQEYGKRPFANLTD